MGLVEFHEGTCWGSDQGDDIATPVWLGIVSALSVFVAAGERFSGAPSINARSLAPTLFGLADGHHGADIGSSPDRCLDRD